MLNLLLSLGWGTLSFTREKADQMVEEMVKRGDLRREEAKKMAQELVERGEKERQEFKDYLDAEFANWMQKYKLVSREEIERLEERVKELESRLEDTDS